MRLKPEAFIRGVKSGARKALAQRIRQAKRFGKKARGVLRSTDRAIANTVKGIRVSLKKYRDRDKGYRKRLREIQRLNKSSVVIGILSSGRGGAPKGSRSGALGKLSVLAVGEIHEFGLGVPQRSFIRDWFDENGARASERIKRVAQLVVAGETTARKGMDLVGLWAQGSIQERMASTPGNWQALAPITVRRKGSSRPLIDTGQLRSAITFRVEEGTAR